MERVYLDIIRNFGRNFLFLSYRKYAKLSIVKMTAKRNAGIRRELFAANGVLAQLGERQVRNLKVRGSIPLYSIYIM